MNLIGEFRELEDYPGYFVGSDGSIWTYWLLNNRGWTVYIKMDNWRRLKEEVREDGYVCVVIRRRRYVHRLVVETFIGPCPKGMECRHLDGIKSNNDVSNLCWGTPLENAQDSKIQGKAVGGARLGEINGSSVLTTDNVLSIRRLRTEGRKLKELSQLFGISTTHVKRIVYRKCWTHI